VGAISVTEAGRDCVVGLGLGLEFSKREASIDFDSIGLDPIELGIFELEEFGADSKRRGACLDWDLGGPIRNSVLVA
jgi:hypothetical protein